LGLGGEVADFIKKGVPPSAASNLPTRLCNAPVKRTFLMPKNSDAIKVCGIAAQFTRTKGLSERFDRRWRARAISSFPYRFAKGPAPLNPKGPLSPLGLIPCALVRRSRQFPQTSRSDRFPRAERDSPCAASPPHSSDFGCWSRRVPADDLALIVPQRVVLNQSPFDTAMRT